MTQITFIWYLITGVIVPTDDVDGRTIYTMPEAHIEYAYEAELIEYLETGTFEYNEDLGE